MKKRGSAAHSPRVRTLLGFSLIELVVTLSVASILVSVAAPSVADLYKQNALVSQANDMIALFNYARSEAIRRNMPVKLCRAESASSSGCLTTTGEWSYWLMLTNAGDIIQRGTVSTVGGLVQTSNFTQDTVQFSAAGLAYTNNQIVNGQYVQIKTSSATRCVVLGAGSRTSITKPVGTNNCS